MSIDSSVECIFFATAITELFNRADEQMLSVKYCDESSSCTAQFTRHPA